jgi:hypothetical protein
MMGLYTILQDLIRGSGSATVYSVVEAKCSTYVCTEFTALLVPELSLHILEITQLIYSDCGVLFYELNINICSVLQDGCFILEIIALNNDFIILSLRI